MARKNGPAKIVYSSPRLLAQFSLSYSGIAKIAMGPELREACHEVCEVGLAFAQYIAPVVSGDYVSGFDIDDYVETEIGGPPLGKMNRRASRLINTSEHAMVVEVGNQNFPGHRIFAKTLDAIENAGEMMS